MGDLNSSNAVITEMTNNVSTYTVNPSIPDASSGNLKNNYYDYPESSKYYGYYKNIPELKKAIDALATWTTGKGYESQFDKVILDHIMGWGEDSFQAVMWNLQVQKKVFGDAYAEIIRIGDPKTGKILNIKPLYTGDMRVVVNDKGIIDHYEQRSNAKGGKVKIFETHQILHLVNDRVANEIHGSSVIEACKWVIDARNEAMSDLRKGIHRSSIRVIYVDIDNPTTLNKIASNWSNALNAREVIILPGKKGTDYEIVDYTFPDVGGYIQWIQYLENFFYQAVGIPRVIATSENYTEAASKVGYLTFEPIYTREQTELENDLWNQCGIKVTFNRPPSLMDTMKSSEDKNTGQTNFQQSEVKPSVNKQ